MILFVTKEEKKNRTVGFFLMFFCCVIIVFFNKKTQQVVMKILTNQVYSYSLDTLSNSINQMKRLKCLSIIST